MKTKSIILNFIYLLIVALVLVATIWDIQWLHYVSMPLVMIWITVIFTAEAKRLPNRGLVVAAFFFSWLGDVLLMLSADNEMLFFAGVGGFFVSQIMYIMVFTKFSVAGTKGFVAQKPYLLLPYLVYLVGVLAYLFPHIEGMMIPIVILYATSLIGMSVAALNRKGRMDPSGFSLLFTGSLFFVVSDSILAINKFATPIPQEGLLVLSTYVIAQFLIMQGLVRSSNQPVSL